MFKQGLLSGNPLIMSGFLENGNKLLYTYDSFTEIYLITNGNSLKIGILKVFYCICTPYWQSKIGSVN